LEPLKEDNTQLEKVGIHKNVVFVSRLATIESHVQLYNSAPQSHKNYSIHQAHAF